MRDENPGRAMTPEWQPVKRTNFAPQIALLSTLAFPIAAMADANGNAVVPAGNGFNLQVPQGVPNGCFVPVVVVTGNGAGANVSNSPVFAVMNSRLLLLGASVLAVAAVVLSFQLSIAMSIGIAPSHAFPRLRGQVVGFISLALGYMSLYLEGLSVKNFRLAPAVILNFCVFAIVFSVASSLLHLRTVAAAVPFIAGALVRVLQKTSLRRLWFFGTILPTVAAALNGGRLLSTGGETSLWVAVLLRWIGQTAACYFLTLLSENHARRRSRSAG